MVNITAAAHTTAAAFALAIGHGANYSNPLAEVAAEVSSFFLPTYTAFSLGSVTPKQNQSTIQEGFVQLYQLWREPGQPGTDVHIISSRTKIEAMSNESASCWMTYCVNPVDGSEGWEWQTVYGFRLVENGTSNGQAGGWEYALADEEKQAYAQNWLMRS